MDVDFVVAHKQLHIHKGFHVLSGVHHVRHIGGVVHESHCYVREVDFFACGLLKLANH